MSPETTNLAVRFQFTCHHLPSEMEKRWGCPNIDPHTRQPWKKNKQISNKSSRASKRFMASTWCSPVVWKVICIEWYGMVRYYHQRLSHHFYINLLPVPPEVRNDLRYIHLFPDHLDLKKKLENIIYDISKHYNHLKSLFFCYLSFASDHLLATYRTTLSASQPWPR